MGIDAEMLVRGVRQKMVTDEWLKTLSWNLCGAIGAKHFFISDGLKPEEYEQASKVWHAAFDAHPLHGKWSKLEGEQRKAVHEQIFADIGQPPKERRLAVDRTLVRYREEDSPAAGSAYSQDGDMIHAARGECLLELSLWGRYYGIGYERGDILTYCAIAEWLEINIPGCEVWYGGDSSGVCAGPFPAAERMRLRQHLYSKQGRAYFREYPLSGGTSCRPAACALCPGGKYFGTQYGAGQSYAAFSCAGCGQNVETRDKGATWTKAKDD